LKISKGEQGSLKKAMKQEGIAGVVMLTTNHSMTIQQIKHHEVSIQ